MKSLFFLLLFSLSLFGEPNWLRSYEEAKTQALIQKKLLLVMISREGCDACWYMENIVFEEESVDALVMEHFIPVYFDTNSDTVPDIFAYAGTPTFYFTDAQGKKLGHRINGASNIKDFTAILESIIQEAKN